MGLDQDRGLMALVTQFASQDSLLQRRGRAGRVQEGRCFRLITESTYKKLPDQTVPEMLRSSLENVILQAKAMTMSGKDQNKETKRLLSICLDPPLVSTVLDAEQALTKIQALDREGKLTPLGYHLSKLPCSPRVGRMLIFGYLLGCVYPSSCAAASISVRSPFKSSSDEQVRQKVDAAKVRFTNMILISSKLIEFVITETVY
jgi:HrpA-like RNA helicase